MDNMTKKMVRKIGGKTDIKFVEFEPNLSLGSRRLEVEDSLNDANIWLRNNNVDIVSMETAYYNNGDIRCLRIFYYEVQYGQKNRNDG